MMKEFIIILCLCSISCTHTHIVYDSNLNCFTKKDLDIKKDIWNLKPIELTQKLIQRIITNENKCIGLYIIKYECTNKDIDLVEVPVLKMENEVIFSEWENDNLNKENIEIFKTRYENLFSKDELIKIEKGFTTGIRVIAHN